MVKLKNKAYWARKAVDYTGVVFLGMLLLFIWQAYREPIALPFLKPYIIKALNHDDTDYQVTLDSVNLEFVRSIKPIKIIANNVVYKKNDGSFLINAPRTSVSFSIKAILRGVVAPSSIEVEHPSIHIFTEYGLKEISAKEDVTRKKLEYYVDSFENFLERFNSTDNIYPESYINDIAIRNAEVEFHEVDLGRKWTFSDLNYSFERNFSNIETEFNALIKTGENISSVGLDAQYRPYSKKMVLRIYFSDFIPADFMELYLPDETKDKLYQVNLPINGSIEGLINYAEISSNKNNILKALDTAIENVKFQFEGGAGNIMFSEDEEYKYDISAFILEGNIDSGLNNLKIENADFNLGAQKTRLSVYVSGVKDFLIKNSLDKLSIQIKADIDKLSMDELPNYWPKYISHVAWEWVHDSISSGFAENATFTFDFGYDKKTKKIAFQTLKGQTDVKGSNLYYLAGMPLITDLYGVAYFTNNSIKVDVDKGVSNGVILNGGHVNLHDLDKEDNFADIRLYATSSITDALKLIDNEPLGYASEMGLDSDIIKGNAETDLSLKFELKKDLKPEEINVHVKSVLTDVEIPDVIQEKPLKAKTLDLEVTTKGLLVSGEGEIDGIALNVVWDENFKAKDYKSKYKISLKLNEELMNKLKIDYGIIKAPYITGYADVNADIIIYNNNSKTKIDLYADLKNTEIDYSFIGFRKNLEEAAFIKTGIVFENNKLKSISDFTLSKHDFMVNGKVLLNKDSSLNAIDIFNIKGPKTDAKVKVEFLKEPQEKIKINISGDSYDLTEFFVSQEKEIKASSPVEGTADNDSFANVKDTEIFLEVNQLWTNPDVAIRNMTGSANLVHGVGVHELHIIGNYSNRRDVTLRLDYTPRPNNEFFLSIQSNDAGRTLKVLRLYENMSGGTLNIEAKRNAAKEFIGHAKIRDFSIYGTPVLAKVLTVASFSGMVNMLTGEGMAFSHFDAPFEYKSKILYIKESKAFGNVMGITADGYYNRVNDSLKIKGLIAPAYSLNTMLGKIPLVGNLLAGKDGTVFAASYSVRGNISNPDVDIDKLSALSPNSIKELLNRTFGSGDEY